MTDTEGLRPFFRPTDESDGALERGLERGAGSPDARAESGAGRAAASADVAPVEAAFDWDAAFSAEERAALEAFEARELARLDAELDRDARAFFESIGLHDFDDPGPSDADTAAMLAEGARREARADAMHEPWDLDEGLDFGTMAAEPGARGGGRIAVTTGAADAGAADASAADAGAAHGAGPGAGAGAPPWLADRSAALADAWAMAAVPGGDGAAGSRFDGELSAMSDAQLLGLLDAAAGVHRQLSGAIARMGSEVADRSELVAGEEGLARRSGHRNARALLATALGAPSAEARRLIRTGRALVGGRALTGEPLPPQCPHVDSAVTTGAISTHAADAIIAMRDRVCHRVEAAEIDKVEEMLVDAAPAMTLNELETAISYAEAHLDPDGTAPRIEEMREHRSLSFGRNAAGMITLNGKFDPATAAPIRAAIERIVTHQLRASRGANLAERDEFRRLADGPGRELTPAEVAADSPRDTADHDPGAVSMEGRSLVQLRADALATLCAHANGCHSDELPAPSTAVVVRIPVERLAGATDSADSADSLGAADGADRAPFVPVCEIDGFGPIDAGTARRMAAAADIIPIVLGADSEILDLGRTKRLFTRAQRLALVERDGGCAFCGLPPAFTEAHHLVHWRHGGGTDLRNAVLLCTTCHHRVHDGWDVEIVPSSRSARRRSTGRRGAPPDRGSTGSTGGTGGIGSIDGTGSTGSTGGTVWFIPPATVDRQRTPRLGGRKRFDPAYRRAHPPEPPPGASPA